MMVLNFVKLVSTILLSMSVPLAAILAGVNAVGAPTDLNGTVGNFSVTDTIDRVSPEFVVVLGNTNVPSLQANIARAIYLAQGSPNVDVDVTQAHIDAALPMIGNHIVSHELMSLVTKTAALAALDMRASDVIGPDAWAPMIDPGDAAAVPVIPPGPASSAHFAAIGLYSVLVEDPNLMAMVTGRAKMVTLALVANALHRHLNNGHNWYTSRVNDERNQTFRCLGVAGAEFEAFRGFMTLYGHGLWHFLSTSTLNTVASLITGKGGLDNVIRGVHPVMYCTRDVRGSALHLLLDIGDAARDRFPPGQVGVAGIIKGLEYMIAMVNGICAKVGVEGAGDIIEELTQLSSKLNERVLANNIDRPKLTKIKSSLAPIVAIAVGYASATAAGEDEVNNFKAMMNMVANHTVARTSGRNLARMIADVKLTQASLVAAVAATLQSLVVQTAAVHVELGAARPAPNVGAINVPMPSDERAALAEERRIEIELRRAGAQANEQD